MSSARKRRAGGQRRAGNSTPIELTADEIHVLIAVARYYERAYGSGRFLIRVFAGPEMRARLRFVVDEGRWLERMAETFRDDLVLSSGESLRVELTPVALVAFWGRLLSSLRTRRSRRKLKPDEIDRRDALAAKLRLVAQSIHTAAPNSLDQALATRRATEAEWMRSELTSNAEEN